MKPFMHGVAVLLTTAAALIGTVALAQDKTVLTTERDKASYMVGHDIAQSIAPVAPDLDIAAFERAIRNAFAGGKPLLAEDEAKSVGSALMQRIGSRTGQAPAGAEVPDVAKDKVGYLVGTDVGRSLAPIKDELELPVLLQAVRTTFTQGPLLLTEVELNSVRQAFSQKVQAKRQSDAQAAAETNLAEGAKFLAENKSVKGVFTTPSGLQYMVLRQGAGPRPMPSSQVRVNYEGKLLDGTVFDSSYERGQPAEFALNQVIAGWTEGVAMMPVGAKYRFWIPGELAYGAKGASGVIGPNATLTFDVELLAIIE
jgi:FKBP-type peptidyl-prolyl cis-trans isomerase FkpA